MLKLVVLLAAVALTSASYIGAPLAYSTSSIIHGSPALVHGLSPLAPYGIAAPLSLAPHAPAVVLGPNGVPLDTPEVVAARAAHLQAKALAGAHILKKRSLGWIAPASSWTGRVDLPGKIIAAPAIIKAPYAYGPAPLALGHGIGHAPLAVGYPGYGIGPGHLGVGPWGHGLGW